MKLQAFFAKLGLAIFVTPVSAVNCQDTNPPSSPDSAYVVNSDGTATDTRTGLMWKRCSESQDWTGTTCGDVVRGGSTWAAALEAAEASDFAGHSDWRLPDIKELAGQHEECRRYPAINDVVFPNMDGIDYWSSSPVFSPAPGSSASAWVYTFDMGFVISRSRLDVSRVLLVRRPD